jgi:hypothetical protein
MDKRKGPYLAQLRSERRSVVVRDGVRINYYGMTACSLTTADDAAICDLTPWVSIGYSGIARSQ